MNDQATANTLSQQFGASAKPQKKKRKRPAPYSFRLSEDEKAYLQEKAGARPLGAYIREQLLGDRAEKRRELRQPRVNDQKVSALLAGLGQSNIPNNLNQLAKAANCGTLGTSEDVEKQLEEACAAVLAMREALFIALGLRCGGDGS